MASRRRNSSQFPHSGTRLELAIRTRGAHSCVRKTPTGLPDWTSIVSSLPSVVSVRTIASYASHDRAARPVPPYTTSSSGCSATSGSRLFISIRLAASAPQLFAVRSAPLAAWISGMCVLLRGSIDGGAGHGARSDEFGDGFDLRREEAIGTWTVDDGAHEVAHRSGREPRRKRRTKIDGTRTGEDLDREHAGQAIDRAA